MATMESGVAVDRREVGQTGTSQNEMKSTEALSDRVKRLKECVIKENSKHSTERLRFILEAWRETEGQPPIIRSARVFDKVLRGMTQYIDENPIVGSLTKYRKGCQAFPDCSSHWLLDRDAKSTAGSLELDPEDFSLLEDARDYFSTRCVRHHVRQSLRRRHPDVDMDAIESESIVFICQPVQEPIGGVNVDYGKVLNKGLEGVIEEARAEMAKLFPGYLSDFRRINFLEAVIITCEAVIAWAERYAAIASDMAVKESNPERKRELERIAETCRWVPAKPARSFQEAIQSFWFIHAGLWIEAAQIGHSPGRFCQYMYPFYRMSKERGEITLGEAIELLELLFVKFSEVQKLTRSLFWKGVQQHLGQNLNIGGLTREGEDATNELDFLVVEVARRVRLPQPSLSLLWHNKLSPEFLHACLELVKTGIGQPAFFNCDVAINRLMDRYHVSIEEARDFSVVACVDTVMSHAQDNIWEGGTFNHPKVLELALNNGKDPMTGKQIGPQTGDARDFKTYEDFHNAYRKQLQYFVALDREANLTGINYSQEIAPTPFCSALIDDCIKKGRELNDSGARFSLADGIAPIGIINVANSLSAMKKVVFDDKRLTLPQVMEALRTNFEGDGEIYRLLWNAPKYGNDDMYADAIAKETFNTFFDEHQKFRDHLDTDFIRPFGLSVTLHFLLGSVTGALPDGRKARMPFADGSLSAFPGTDVKGPTALLRSAVKVADPVKWAAHLLNMRFHPTALAGREGERKFLDLVKTYMDMGGYHIQFNVMTMETLREAQRNPEKYRDLLVRVAGYSAFFVDLTQAMQEEVIKRTEHTL